MKRQTKRLLPAVLVVLVGCGQATPSATGTIQDEAITAGPTTSEPASGHPTTEATVASTGTTRWIAPELTAESEAGALAVVQRFVELLRSADHVAAEGMVADVYGPSIDGLISDFGWLSTEPDLEYLVVPSWGWTVAAPVVVVSSPGRAAAFLVGYDVAGNPSEIVRLPSPAPAPDPPEGTMVAAGDIITLPGVSVEGGARAFVDDIEIPAEVDHERLVTTAQLPDELPESFVLTVTRATPEFPAATAAVYSAAPGG
ncbi:MAG: hypothetical protein WBM50_06800 [Acidimicrobiales bacterium]